MFICRLTIWQSRRRTGTRVRLELDPPGESLGNRRLADAGLAEQQHGVGAFAVAQNLEHLIHLGLAAEDRRNPVLTRELIQIGREMLEERRQLEALLQPLLAHARGRACGSRAVDTSVSGSMPCRRMIETGMPCVSSKIAENRSVASIA